MGKRTKSPRTKKPGVHAGIRNEFESESEAKTRKNGRRKVHKPNLLHDLMKNWRKSCKEGKKGRKRDKK